jgi:hypothetical protein
MHSLTAKTVDDLQYRYRTFLALNSATPPPATIFFLSVQREQ